MSQTGAWCRSTWTSIPFPGILAGSWIRGWTAGLELALNTRCQNYQWRFNLFCHNAGLLKKINFQRFIHLFGRQGDRKERGERERKTKDRFWSIWFLWSKYLQKMGQIKVRSLKLHPPRSHTWIVGGQIPELICCLPWEYWQRKLDQKQKSSDGLSSWVTVSPHNGITNSENKTPIY